MVLQLSCQMLIIAVKLEMWSKNKMFENFHLIITLFKLNSFNFEDDSILKSLTTFSFKIQKVLSVKLKIKFLQLFV